MNNYCLRRIRYALNLADRELLSIFALASYKLTPSELKHYLLKEEQSGFVPLPDYLLVIFLDGLIIKKRGTREGEVVLNQAERVEQSKKIKLNNNMIVNKIKIALSLNSDQLIAMLALADFRISKGEMSAFFRKPDHRNYRECGNQLLRNLLTGITNHFHHGGEKTKSIKSNKVSKHGNNSKLDKNASNFDKNSQKERKSKGRKKPLVKNLVSRTSKK